MSRPANPNPHAREVLATALATLALTAAHHAYGAHRYGTPWRLHGAAVAVGLAAPLFGAYAAHRRRPGTRAGAAAGWALAAVAIAVPVLVVGVFEGAYNHVAKDALFLAGAPRALLAHLFPPPRYELPNDAWFEVSGVLQVVPAALAARAALRFARAARRQGRGSGAPGPDRGEDAPASAVGGARR